MSLKYVNKLVVGDNPPDPLNVYPGKFSRNNPSGTLLSREQYLYEEAKKWVSFMKENPKYKSTWRTDKAKVLLSHLLKLKVSDGKGKKLCYPECVKILEQAEAAHPVHSFDEVEGPDEENNLAKGRQETSQTIAEMQLVSSDESMDKDWNVESIVRDRSGRTNLEIEIAKVLEKSDKDIFESEGIEGRVKQSLKYK